MKDAGCRQNGESIMKQEGFEEENLQDRNHEAPHSFLPNALNLFASYTVRQYNIVVNFSVNLWKADEQIKYYTN